MGKIVFNMYANLKANNSRCSRLKYLFEDIGYIRYLIFVQNDKSVTYQV